ncbi:MAG: hypothetical protein ABWZ99_14215 [Ilumatobacteraceae bacterium]
MHGSNADMAVVVVILATRFIVPLFIPRFPLPAILIALVVDAADQTILQQSTDLDLANYQNYDKALDIYYLTIAYLAVYRNWTNGIAVEVARFLWYYRLIGVLAFEITQARWLLMVFPNTFEYFFIAYEVVRTCWDPRRMSRRAVIGLAAVIWIFVKLPQEWWIHVAQNDFTDFMKETVFGVESTSSWVDAFGNRPFVLVAILAAIGGVVFAALHFRSRLRPTDWPFGVDVDRPTPVLDLPAADAHVPSMRWPIVEKLVLIGLISGIFTSVLEVEATGAQIVGATVLLVLANAGISHVMATRGAEWSSLGVEFVVLAVVNTVLLTGFATLVGETGLNRATAWFFGLLLTMIIVLFDRFRTERLDRHPGEV